MKQCPTCSRSYPDDTLVYCLDDGSVLANPRAHDVTQPMPSPRITSPPPTEALPYNVSQPVRQRSNTPIILVLASVVVLFLIAGGLLIAWLSLRNKDNNASESSTSSASQSTTNQNQRQSTNTNANPSTAIEKSPSWKLVGVWRCKVTELGSETEITYTFAADGTSKASFRNRRGQIGTDHGTWQYSEGFLYEKFPNGVAGKGAIEWIDDDTFEITIIDNGVPAYNGLKRRYRRIG